MRAAVPSYDATVNHLFCIFPELSLTIGLFTASLFENNIWQRDVLPGWFVFYRLCRM